VWWQRAEASRTGPGESVAEPRTRGRGIGWMDPVLVGTAKAPRPMPWRARAAPGLGLGFLCSGETENGRDGLLPAPDDHMLSFAFAGRQCGRKH
jgi:hypothetical protein